MKQKLLLAISLSLSALGFSQGTFDGIPTGEGYTFNKIIGSPPSIYTDATTGDLTTASTGNTLVTQELTLEYYEFRGEPNSIIPSNLYFISVEGDGESGKTDMGKVDEVVSLGDGTRTFGANGILAIVSNYTDSGTTVKTTNPYSAVISPDATIITIELTGTDVTSTSSSGVATKTPDIGYDGNIEDASVTYMLVTSGTNEAPVSPKGHDLDDDNDGVIDASGDHTSWTLYDSASFLDIDDPVVVDGDTGEYGYGQIVFARTYDDDPDNFKITTSATIVSQGTSNVSFILRQGAKTGHTANDWIGAANSTSSIPNWKFTTTDSKISPDFFGGYIMPDSIFGELNPVEPNAWNGSTSSDWADMTNWDLGIVPVTGEEVTIGATGNNPVIGGSVSADAYTVEVDAEASLNIESGGSLILGDSSTGDITYNVNVTDTNFHLIASPVAGETYDDTWVADNAIASGSVSSANRGIATYSNATTTNTWSYFQGGGAAANFDAGVGYALKKSVAGNHSFTGTYPTVPASLTIGEGAGSNWNLVGNVAPAYLDVTALIAGNTANIAAAYSAVYVYDGTSYSIQTSGNLSPGQAFFVNAAAGATSLDVTAAMLGHDTPAAKSSDSSISIKVSNGTSSDVTELSFDDEASLGLDRGQDLGKFTGVASELSLFTELVSNNEGIAFGKQAMPSSEGAVIPVGLVAASGEEVTFSVDGAAEVALYLEDKANGTIVNISEEAYKTTLTEAANGTGQFYLHTAAKSLSTDEVINDADAISVYVSLNNLVISGLNGASASVSVYSVLGTQVLSQNTTAGNIALPKLNAGLYIVNVKSDLGEVTKKIILE